jgi:hypothetical protein
MCTCTHAHSMREAVAALQQASAMARWRKSFADVRVLWRSHNCASQIAGSVVTAPASSDASVRACTLQSCNNPPLGSIGCMHTTHPLAATTELTPSKIAYSWMQMLRSGTQGPGKTKGPEKRTCSSRRWRVRPAIAPSTAHTSSKKPTVKCSTSIRWASLLMQHSTRPECQGQQ